MGNLQNLLNEVDAILNSSETIDKQAPLSQDDELHNALDQHFGYNTFREGQQKNNRINT